MWRFFWWLTWRLLTILTIFFFLKFDDLMLDLSVSYALSISIAEKDSSHINYLYPNTCFCLNSNFCHFVVSSNQFICVCECWVGVRIHMCCAEESKEWTNPIFFSISFQIGFCFALNIVFVVVVVIVVLFLLKLTRHFDVFEV